MATHAADSEESGSGDGEDVIIPPFLLGPAKVTLRWFRPVLEVWPDYRERRDNGDDLE